MAHVSTGFLAAFGALSAPSWAVRNSGLLLLAALLERALRQRRTRDAHASVAAEANGIGISDFFARAPELHPYLVSALDSIVHPKHAPQATSPPDLYSVLLLLSRLVPSPTTDLAHAAAVDVEAFVPLVMACGAMASCRVRVIASLALVPLIAPDDVPTCVLALARSLPASTSANQVHGTILQLKALVDAALGRAASSSSSTFEAELGDWCALLLDALGPSLRLLRASCAVLRVALVQLLGSLLLAVPPPA